MIFTFPIIYTINGRYRSVPRVVHLEFYSKTSPPPSSFSSQVHCSEMGTVFVCNRRAKPGASMKHFSNPVSLASVARPFTEIFVPIIRVPPARLNTCCSGFARAGSHGKPRTHIRTLRLGGCFRDNDARNRVVPTYLSLHTRICICILCLGPA